ncbi:hypothetical protein H9P43_005515 [Blastocladiella emersonii ATCC 22665]|nr:hypothetical protein H9P43_005515 [Blastocladiella emersonii ATCC 22665]
MPYAAAESATAAKLASTIVLAPLNVCFGAFNDVLLEASQAALMYRSPLCALGSVLSDPAMLGVFTDLHEYVNGALPREAE